MLDEEIKLTAEDIAAIKEADEQMDRGEHVNFDEFAAEMRKKFENESPSDQHANRFTPRAS